MAIIKRNDKGSALTYDEMDDNFDAIAPRTSATGSIQIPAGTTAERDASPQPGYLRYNVSLNSFEGYQNGAWSGIGSGGTSGGDVNQNAFSSIAVSGQGTIAADSVTDVLNIAEGSGISLTTDTGTDTLTISATLTQDYSYSSLTGVPSSFPPSAHTQPWSTITNTPTTLAGYGITDGGGDGVQGVQGVEGSAGRDGTDGVQGLRGPLGLQGTDGADGDPGPQGTAGQDAVGSQGLQGVQGTRGLTGFGTQGVQGSSGIQGNNGANGEVGADGAQGIQGPAGGGAGSTVQGIQGLQGGPGFDGQPGFQGLQGPAGDAQGVQGIQGNDGPPGFGLQGFQGTQGLTGPGGFGPQGIQGITGAGIQGPQGVDGGDGPDGLQGIQGPAGSVQGIQGITGADGVGIQGIQGIALQGETGELGADGPQGVQGILGLQGLQGPGIIGPQGVQGTIGLQGDVGIQGVSIQGVQGLLGIQGLDGTRGDDGLQGTQGPQSTQGIQGITGSQGITLQGTQGTIGLGLQGVQGISGDTANIVSDITPQLGGDLDTNGNDISFSAASYIRLTNLATLNMRTSSGSDVNFDQFVFGYQGDFSATDINLGYMNSSAGRKNGSLTIRRDDNTPFFEANSTALTAYGLTYPNTDGSTGQVLTTNGSGTLSFTSIDTSLVNDTTPQLGGDLETQNNNIVGSSGTTGNLTIYGTDGAFNGTLTLKGALFAGAGYTGAVNIGGDETVNINNIRYPSSDGTAGQVLTTDGAGALSFQDASGGISNVVEDTTPQLGGNLDLNGNAILRPVETTTSVTVSSATQTIDCSSSLYHVVNNNSTGNDYTVNFTNLPISNGSNKVIRVVIMDLSGQGTGPTGVNINGSSASLAWSDGSVPTYSGITRTEFEIFSSGGSNLVVYGTAQVGGSS